jgi:hypothetical protein
VTLGSGPGHDESRERKRKDDFGFEPVEKVYREFCARHNVDLDKVNFSQKKGQHLRRQMLVLLKDYGGLTRL